MYIENIKILENSDYPGSHVLKKGFEIKCSNVNLLVGNQGCGKSTLLAMLQEKYQSIEIKLTDKAIKMNGVNSYFFDTEKDNPRVKELSHVSSDNYVTTMMSHFKSHGETLKPIIIDPLSKAKDCVILFDEPESGLSLTNQFKLIKAINKAVKNNCQFFIATHCYPLIENFDVISLEHWEQMKGTEFIKHVKK